MNAHGPAAPFDIATGDAAPAVALVRPSCGRMVAGVAAGLARYLDLDPVLVRMALVVLALFGGAGVVVYAAGWLLIPDEGEPACVGEQWIAHLGEPWT